jgi:gliding motility-associated-like protein
LYVKKNPYNVQLTKTASKQVFFKGYDQSPYVSYTINVKNIGDDTLHTLVVCDTLPAGVDTGAIKYPAGTTATVSVLSSDGGKERYAIAFDVNALAKDSAKQFILDSCQIDTSATASYLNRAYVTCFETEANAIDNTDTAVVEVRSEVNLKLQMTLCGANGVEFPSDHEFRQGDTLYVHISVMNNGRIATTKPTKVLTYFDGVLDTSYSHDWGINSHDTRKGNPRKALLEKTGSFTVSASASTIYGSMKIEDSIAITLSILPGSDMQVQIEVVTPAPPEGNDSRSREYTISLKNIGQFRSDTVQLHHTLSDKLVSLDSIHVKPFNGGAAKRLSVAGGNLDSILNPATQEAITYDSHELTYAINAVQAGDSALITLFVATAIPNDTAWQIWPEASVDVLDAYEGNNQTYSATPIIVEPYYYNVRVSISPHDSAIPDIDSFEAINQLEHTYAITAKNIGKYPANGVKVYFYQGEYLTITSSQAGWDDASSSWTVIPQLLKDSSRTFTVTVKPKMLPSKENHLQSVAKVEVEDLTFRQHEADTANNSDTANLRLSFSREPYNVSIDISSAKLEEDTIEIESAEVAAEYTITASNIGIYPAPGVIAYFQPDPSLKVVDSGNMTWATDRTGWLAYRIDTLKYGSPYADAIGKVEVGGADHLSKGDYFGLKNIVEIKVGNTSFTQREVDVTDNADTAYLNLTFTRDPYDIGVSIAPDSVDMRSSADTTYTITVTNYGRHPTEEGGVRLYFQADSALKIVKVKAENEPPPSDVNYAESGNEAGEEEENGKLMLWSIPSLLTNEYYQVWVTVKPENVSSKGTLRSVAWIDFDEPSSDADANNNSDTAYLNLFPEVSRWPIMEAFSPNGDGLNDKFVITDLYSGLVARAELVIANRYGSEVYYNKNYKEAQLSESTAFTGAGLPEGSYFYRLTVYFDDGSVDKRSGIVTIRRSRWK